MIVRPAILHAIAVAIAIVAALSVLAFSNPNRLAHDQIVHGTFIARLDDPTAFQGDYLFGDDRIETHNNYFLYGAMQWLRDRLGHQELIYWYFLPVFVGTFTLGMYALLWYATRQWLASVLGALTANLYVPYIFMASWGLAGPSEVGSREVFTMFVPLLFLGFVRGMLERRDWLLFATFAAVGILGNVHLISAFNFALILGLTLIFWGGITWQNIRRIAVGGALALAGAAPYLLAYNRYRHLLPTGLAGVDPAAYRAVVATVAAHTLPAGHWEGLWQWVGREWYLFWPLVAIFVIMLWLRRRAGEGDGLDRLSICFVGAVIAVNAFISISQWVKFYGFGAAPFFQIPRGMHFLYVVLFLFVGILLAQLIAWIRARVPSRRLVALSVAAIVLVAGFVALRGPWLAGRYRAYITPRFSYVTCDDGVYEAVRSLSHSGDVLLVDPDYFSAVRPCTRRAVVVLRRDNGIAYSLGPDRLSEWVRRYDEVKTAFASPETLLAVARRYGARFILSRTCAAVPGVVERYRHPANLNCVYQIGPS
ncbi:hypothetical protein HYZ80_03700 [Candidatus Parcubacteria bacterium]|nr:hypothetical protein [Candidatus Parcubacteria bacterium]